MSDEANQKLDPDPPSESQTDHSSEPKPHPKQELRKAIQDSHEVLVTVTTVFPLTLFPDTITVDRAKLTTTKRVFFGVSEVMSIRVEDLLNVTAKVGPLFGTITIMTRIMNIEKPYIIKMLWRDDALKFKRIAQGYIIALEKDIDCSSLQTSELAQLLDKLGKDDHPET